MSGSIKQKDAVFAAYQAGREQGLEHGSDQLFESVAGLVQAGIANGDVDYSKDRANEKEVKAYARSLTSNWFKKDERISGAKYVPATRRGPMIKDETLKALSENLKSLKAHSADMTIIQRVEQAIQQRRQQLAAQKDKSKVQTMEETLASLAELGIQVDGVEAE